MQRNWFTLRHLFNFSWRASRTEFFLLHLVFLAAIYAPIFLIVAMIDFRSEPEGAAYALLMLISTLWSIVSIGTFVAILAVNVRRLHDQDKSGWWWLATWLPLVGWIFWLVFAFTPGDDGENGYGPDPRQPVAAGYAGIFE